MIQNELSTHTFNVVGKVVFHTKHKSFFDVEISEIVMKGDKGIQQALNPGVDLLLRLT